MDRLSAQDLMMLWPEELGWSQDIGALAILDGRGLLARFLYSMPESLVGRRRILPDPIPDAVADEYAANLGRLTLSLADWTDPAVLPLTPDADAVRPGSSATLGSPATAGPVPCAVPGSARSGPGPWSPPGSVATGADASAGPDPSTVPGSATTPGPGSSAASAPGSPADGWYSTP